MTTRWFGERVQRSEDDRLLRGRGRFTDDIDEGALESVLVRSPHAHARIRSIDVSAARAMPGVIAVYTAHDLPFGGTDLPILIPHPNLTHGRTQRCLASEVVRYAGEAVVFVVAESRAIAEDAAELVEVDYEPLPVVITPEVAARADNLVHDDVPGNVAAELVQEGHAAEALEAAPRRKHLHFRYERGAASPMEARAVWARWSDDERKLTVYDSTQSPTSIRGGLAVLFGLPESQVEVIAPDVGGGFGPKIMLFYPDELLVPYAAMQLGRPVKWTEDRQEHFTAVNQERSQVHEVDVGYDDKGRVLALDDDFIHDGGAYTPYGIILPIITAGQLPGPYKVPNYRVRFRDMYTNATPTSPYRGAGRPHACFVMERTLDAIAADIGIDRAEVRRRRRRPAVPARDERLQVGRIQEHQDARGHSRGRLMMQHRYKPPNESKVQVPVVPFLDLTFAGLPRLPRVGEELAGSAFHMTPGGTGAQARGRERRHGPRHVRRGHRRRTVRGRARAGARVRQGRGRHRHPEPGPGARDGLGTGRGGRAWRRHT